MIERQRVEFQIFPINLKLNKKISSIWNIEFVSYIFVGKAFLPTKHTNSRASISIFKDDISLLRSYLLT